jgi:hypothetical protein
MTKARDISKLLSTANGKIAGANLDVSFENISDTGTAGTKVASGTTNQRGSTAGQIRFNTTTGLAEYYTGSEFKIIDSPPTVTAVSPLEVANLAGGNETFTITGTNFQSGATVKFIGNDNTELTPSSTTINSSTSITAVIAKNLFNNTKEPYDVRVTNTSGLSSSLDNVVNVDNTLSWVTASGTLATINTLSSGTHSTISATDPDGDTVTYAETGGTVLSTAGFTLNSSTGAITGTPSSAGTKTFTIRATANSKTADRQFSIVVVEAYSSSYLVIAGGGSSMGYGGGGAGGYRNSYSTETSGRNSSTETPLTLQQGIVYTITVGGGGVQENVSTNFNGNGSNSSISGSNITTITSLGGGGGRSNASTYSGIATKARDGGSGGGCTYGAEYNGVIGFGTAGQGFDGGIGNDGMVNTTRGGGGGGAGANGQDATGGSAGNGGAGLYSSITGSSVGRAGGGNGRANSGSWSSTGSFGGGGGDQNGTANTGGGAGGGSTPGGSVTGGSGVVILRMLTSKYSGTTTGSPTVSTSGTDTILTFNGSGSYTA